MLDTGNDRIQKFDNAGEYICSIGGIKGTRVGEFNSPTDFIFDKNYSLWIVDFRNHRIVKIIPPRQDSLASSSTDLFLKKTAVGNLRPKSLVCSQHIQQAI